MNGRDRWSGPGLGPGPARRLGALPEPACARVGRGPGGAPAPARGTLPRLPGRLPAAPATSLPSPAKSLRFDKYGVRQWTTKGN